jgi:hypothetical protein
MTEGIDEIEGSGEFLAGSCEEDYVVSIEEGFDPVSRREGKAAECSIVEKSSVETFEAKHKESRRNGVALSSASFETERLR